MAKRIQQIENVQYVALERHEAETIVRYYRTSAANSNTMLENDMCKLSTLISNLAGLR